MSATPEFMLKHAVDNGDPKRTFYDIRTNYYKFYYFMSPIIVPFE